MGDDNIDRLQDTKIVEDRPVPTVASSLASPAAPSQTPTHNSTPQPLLTPITQVPPSPASTGTTPVAEKRGRGRPKKVVDPNAPPPPPKIPKVKRTPKTPRTPKEPKTPKTPRAKDVLENSIIVPNNIESSFKSMDSPSQNFEQTKPDDTDPSPVEDSTLLTPQQSADINNSTNEKYSLPKRTSSSSRTSTSARSLGDESNLNNIRPKRSRKAVEKDL